MTLLNTLLLSRGYFCKGFGIEGCRLAFQAKVEVAEYPFLGSEEVCGDTLEVDVPLDQKQAYPVCFESEVVKSRISRSLNSAAPPEAV